jgi:branched-subunit amino acid aminotransferase/4-amino-4-deoxychorismate lyase
MSCISEQSGLCCIVVLCSSRREDCVSSCSNLLFSFIPFGGGLIGITRQTVIDVAREIAIPIEERRISLMEFHCADEVFTTGTMGELTPVYQIDGRLIGKGVGAGDITMKLQEAYHKKVVSSGVPLPW